MKRKVESFRWRIFIYNIILLLMVSVVCTMYFLLNDKTINSYNDSFTIYSELHHYYDSVKKMNVQFQEALQSHTSIPQDVVDKLQGDTKEALHNIEEYSKKNYDTLYENLYTTYQIFDASILQYNTTLDSSQVHENYLKIMKSRGDFYEVATKNMQEYKDEVNRNRNNLGWMSVLLVTFMLLWIIYFSKTMMYAITSPIEKIIHNINQIKQGTYDLTQISNTNEEMNVLCLALDDMAQSVQRNFQNEIEKAELEKQFLAQQNENLKKDELLAQGELKVLQNQINPHFLFNTLNMIYKKAYSEGAYETSELMEKTSQLLRYCLDNANKISSLDKEIKAVENYMYIQDKRFQDRIQFILHEDEGVDNIQMPTMILQPLVENAVIHGCKDTIEGGQVIVSVKKDGNAVILSVYDNGKGMSAYDREQLIAHDYQIDDEDRQHIGLYNITKRLRSFFHDDVQITIKSEETKYFEITIRMQGEVSKCDTF